MKSTPVIDQRKRNKVSANKPYEGEKPNWLKKLERAKENVKGLDFSKAAMLKRLEESKNKKPVVTKLSDEKAIEDLISYFLEIADNQEIEIRELKKQLKNKKERKEKTAPDTPNTNLSRKTMEAKKHLEEIGFSPADLKRQLKLHKAKTSKQNIVNSEQKKTEFEILDDLFSFIFEIAENQEKEINELKSQSTIKERKNVEAKAQN